MSFARGSLRSHPKQPFCPGLSLSEGGCSKGHFQRLQFVVNSSPASFVQVHALRLPSINHLSLTPDGSQFVGSLSRGPMLPGGALVKPAAVGIWDFLTGTQLQTITENESVAWIDIDPGGEIAFSVWRDGTVKAWNIHTRQILCQFQGHSRFHQSYIISGNQQTIIGCNSETKLIKAWNAQTGAETFSHKMPLSTIVCTAISRNGQTLIAGNSSQKEGGSIQVWDLSTGEERYRMTATTQKGGSVTDERRRAAYGYSYDWGVGALQLSADEQVLLAGLRDGTVQLYDFATGELRRTLPLSQKPSQSATPKFALSPDQQTLFTYHSGRYGSGDKTIQVWQTQTGELRQELKLPYSGIQGFAVSPDGRHLLFHGSAQMGSIIAVWDWQTQQVIHASTGHPDFVSSVVTLPNGEEAISNSSDGTTIRWNLKTGQDRPMFSDRKLISLAIAPDGQAAVGRGRGMLGIWNLRTETLLQTLEGGSYGQIAISADGEKIASCSTTPRGGIQTTINLWNRQTGELVRSLSGHEKAPKWFAFTPDSRQLVSSSGDRRGSIKVWDLITYAESLTIPSAGPIAIGADGHLLVNYHNAAFHIWNLHTGENFHTFPIRMPKVSAMVVAPDFRVVALGCDRDRDNLQVWDLQTGQKIGDLVGHYKAVTCLSFSADGQTLVSGSRDGSVRVWRRASAGENSASGPQQFSAPQADNTTVSTQIRDLATEQRDRLTAICDRWEQIKTATETDRDRAEASLRLAYQQADLAPPTDIVWQPDPASGFRAYLQAAQPAQLLEQGIEQVLPDAIAAALKSAIDRRILPDAIQQTLNNGACLMLALRNEVIRPAVRQATQDAIGEQLKTADFGISVEAAIARIQQRIKSSAFRQIFQGAILKHFPSPFKRDENKEEEFAQLIVDLDRALKDAAVPELENINLGFSIEDAIAQVQQALCTPELQAQIRQTIQQQLDSPFREGLAKNLPHQSLQRSGLHNTFKGQGLKQARSAVERIFFDANWRSQTPFVQAPMAKTLQAVVEPQQSRLQASVRETVDEAIDRATRRESDTRTLRQRQKASNPLLSSMQLQLKQTVDQALTTFIAERKGNWIDRTVEAAIATLTKTARESTEDDAFREPLQTKIHKTIADAARRAFLSHCDQPTHTYDAGGLMFWLMNEFGRQAQNFANLLTQPRLNLDLFNLDSLVPVAKGLVNARIKEAQKQASEQFSQGLAEAVEPFVMQTFWAAWQDAYPAAIAAVMVQVCQNQMRPTLEQLLSQTTGQVAAELQGALEKNTFCSYPLLFPCAWAEFCHDIGWHPEPLQTGISQATEELSWWWPLRDRAIAVPNQ